MKLFQGCVNYELIVRKQIKKEWDVIVVFEYLYKIIYGDELLLNKEKFLHFKLNENGKISKCYIDELFDKSSDMMIVNKIPVWIKKRVSEKQK